MADYYTNFSIALSLPTEAAQTYAVNLARRAEQAHESDELPYAFPPELADQIEDWRFETEANQAASVHGLWLHTEYGGIDAVCAFIQHLLQKFDPVGRATFEWSNDCSKARTDAYGGGAAIITATNIETMSTHEWLSEHAGEPAS